MFDLWFQLSRLPLAQKGARAQLALEGQAATQWCNLKQTLRAAGQDVYDYTVVKDALIAQYAPISPGMTVRQRLHKLRQTGSVEAFHEEFRRIAAEAVNHPVKGAEACYIFLAGLKSGVRERITTDPDTRDEYTNIDKLVAEAKMIDMAVFARSGEWKDAPGKRRDRSRSPESRKGKRAPSRGRSSGVRGDRSHSREEKGKWPAQDKMKCHLCGKLGHRMADCPDFPPHLQRGGGGSGSGSGSRGRGRSSGRQHH
ncbi:g596 [Coccomyxa elongata]